MREEVAANLNLWEGWTDLHMSGTEYDVDGFISDPASRPFDWVTAGFVGDVAGQRLLHLQCHIGLDTVRLVRAGAVEAVGVDFSPKAVAAAASIAQRVGVSARFVEADVTALPDSVPEQAYDLVFTSYGTIMWLPDLTPWAQMIASRLAPGGRFVIIDAHPFMSVFDDFAPQPPLRVRYPYFTREPLYFQEQGTYADRSAEFVADSYAWQHSFAEIIGSLVGAGLTIRRLEEYPVVSWQALELMEKDDEGLWRLPEDVGDIPLMFALEATKPVREEEGR